MSLLVKPPTLKDLSRMYYELAKAGARAVGEKEKWVYNLSSTEELIVLASQMARYDPRLFSIVVEYLYHNWSTLNPLLIRSELKKANSPQAFCVMSEFLLSEFDKEYAYYHEYLCRGFKPLSYELYFKNLYKPAGFSMQKASEEPLYEFYRWGFLARERPIIYALNRKTLGHWGPLARQNIIKNLASKKTSFSITDYLNALDNTITRQQALADLKGADCVVMKGKGRGSTWVAAYF